MAVLTVNEKKGFLVHCRFYDTDADPRIKGRAEFFRQNIRCEYFFPATNFHMIKLTVVHRVLWLPIAGTRMIVPLLNTSDTKYHSGRTADYDKTKK